MKKILFVLLGQLLLQVSFAQSNFTGKWSIDTSKSIFGVAPLFVVPAEITVKQTRDSLFLSVINIDVKGNKTNLSAKYALNGNPVERVFENGVKLTSSFQWSEDQKQLIKNQGYLNAAQSADPFRKVKEVWTLSPDGKFLTIEQSVEITNGNGYNVKAVYKKN